MNFFLKCPEIKFSNEFFGGLKNLHSLLFSQRVSITPSHTQQIFELLVLQVSIGVEMI